MRRPRCCRHGHGRASRAPGAGRRPAAAAEASMPFVQSTAGAREARIGPHGVAAPALAAALGRAAAALDWLNAHHADGKLPLLRLPEKTDDLAGIEAAARRLAHGATDVVFLGTGGSGLGGQTLAQLAGHAVPGVGLLRAPPRLHFID